MQGLHKSTGYYQTRAARQDWAALKKFAIDNGYGTEAEALQPKPDWGWRRIDKRLAKLRQLLEKNGLEVPSNPSAK